MAYEKQNFQNGEVLTAEQLNAMDDEIEKLGNDAGGGSMYTHTLAIILNNVIDCRLLITNSRATPYTNSEADLFELGKLLQVGNDSQGYFASYGAMGIGFGRLSPVFIPAEADLPDRIEWCFMGMSVDYTGDGSVQYSGAIVGTPTVMDIVNPA